MMERKINVLGNIGGGKTQSRTVYDVNGLSPTLNAGMSHGNTMPYIVEIIELDKIIKNEINVIGCMDHTLDHTFESANRVYGVDGIAPTLPTCAGGGIQPKILEIVAMRGRENGQQLEVRGEGISNAITTVNKDNLVMEQIKIKQATKDGSIPIDVQGGGSVQPGLSKQQDKKRTGNRQRKCLSYSDNGEYP